jgi:hypothetical protein
VTGPDRPDAIGAAEWQALRAVIDELSGEGLDELLAQARADARMRVREILTEAMTQSMLARTAALGTEPAAAPINAPPPPDTASLGLYVYGVVSAAEASAVGGLPGIEPAHAVMALEVGDLAALISHVPLAEFDEQRLREHLGDMNWVEGIARRHEEVLETVGAAVTVIPMRMCSIFRGEDGVRALLEREAGGLRRALGELRGKAEWGVKAFQVPVAAGAEIAPDAPQTGTGYLAQRRDARAARERAAAALSERCEVVHRELAGLSARAVLLAPQRPEVSGHPGDMLLNGAYLVDADRRDAFHAAVRRLDDESSADGLELQVTGPWPAYNFVPDAIGAPA